MENRTGILTNGLIWFGVAISVSEIEAGIQIAASSSINSLWIPLVLGHILGGILLFFIGFIGAKLRVNAMETTVSTFGKYGSKFFAALNVMQLIAWVAVLNAQGAIALVSLDLPISFEATSIILAALVALWVYFGLKRTSKLTTGVMAILIILLTALSVKMLLIGTPGGSNSIITNPQALTFWNIFEISIAMPISWLPVISDYTKDVEKPIKATAASAIAYTIASLWMYFLGIGIVHIGVGNIAQAILLMGLGTPGVIILVLSTVTTNFLATNSAGESAKAIYHKLDPKIVGIVVSGLSIIIAISGIMDHYIGFLYLISSVFAPMAAVLLVSFYFDSRYGEIIPWKWNLIAWFVGFIVYQMAGFLDSVFLGPTLLSIIVSALLAYLQILFRKYSKPDTNTQFNKQ